jgi:hypothetical protein
VSAGGHDGPPSESGQARPPGPREPRPATLSPDDDAWLGELAGRIQARGLTAPAVLWLESLRPVVFLGSQAMHFMNPLVQLVVPLPSWPRLAAILEERSHLERLLQHLEAAADSAAGAASRKRGGKGDES